jgi:hypothetical protein
MAAVLDEILASWYAKFSESEAINQDALEDIRGLFDSGKKLKADDFVAILEKAAEEPSRDPD